MSSQQQIAVNTNQIIESIGQQGYPISQGVQPPSSREIQSFASSSSRTMLQRQFCPAGDNVWTLVEFQN